MRYVMAIIAGVVPQITILQLGKTLGFERHGLGSPSQNTRDLSMFFLKGIWRDWPLETTSFEDWFYQDNDGTAEAPA